MARTLIYLLRCTTGWVGPGSISSLSFVLESRDCLSILCPMRPLDTGFWQVQETSLQVNRNQVPKGLGSSAEHHQSLLQRLKWLLFSSWSDLLVKWVSVSISLTAQGWSDNKMFINYCQTPKIKPQNKPISFSRKIFFNRHIFSKIGRICDR